MRFGRGRWWWMFYLSLALGFLAKGPIAWMPLLTLALVKLMMPDLETRAAVSVFHRRIAHAFAGIALGHSGAGADGGLVSRYRHRTACDRRDRFDVMEGHGPEKLWSYLATLPFYFALIFVSFAPWSLKLPWLAKRLWRERDPRRSLPDRGCRGHFYRLHLGENQAAALHDAGDSAARSAAGQSARRSA